MNENTLQKQVDIYNSSEGSAKGFYCPKCHNKGWIDKVVKDQDGFPVRVTSQCSCASLRESRRITSDQLGEYNGKTMNDFIAREDWQISMKNKALGYLQDPDHSKWFFVCGQCGSGKTMLCSIIANTLTETRHCGLIKVTWTDFIGKVKRDVASGDYVANASRSLEEAKRCDLLFIDEALKKFTDADLKYFSEIVDYRYRNKLPLILNSELDFEDLISIDESVFSRVVERADVYIVRIAKDRKKNMRLRKLSRQE